MPKAMTIKAATAIAGSIGYPSKMPGTSYGIPAKACKTGAKLRLVPGSVCEKCYAFEGNYRYDSVSIAQARRLAGIDHPQWVESMVKNLTAAHAKGDLPPYHRWHDSGDIQSRNHFAKICAVARATPFLAHWLPTKEGKIVRDFVRDGGTIPDNMVVRLSSPKIDAPPPKAWPQTSTVHSTGAIFGQKCPAPTQGNKCGECRACWDKNVLNVSYHLH